MIAKGFCKINVSKRSDIRIRRVKKIMVDEDPELYPTVEHISYNDAIEWMVNKLREHHIIP